MNHVSPTATRIQSNRVLLVDSKKKAVFPGLAMHSLLVLECEWLKNVYEEASLRGNSL